MSEENEIYDILDCLENTSSDVSNLQDAETRIDIFRSGGWGSCDAKVTISENMKFKCPCCESVFDLYKLLGVSDE